MAFVNQFEVDKIIDIMYPYEFIILMTITFIHTVVHMPVMEFSNTVSRNINHFANYLKSHTLRFNLLLNDYV